MVRSLRRLEYFGLLRFETIDRALIRTSMAPLGERQLRRSAPHVRQLHDEIYGLAQRRDA